MTFDHVFAEDPEFYEKTGKIRVVICEPGRNARIADIGTELKDLQETVGGYIEVYYGLEDQSTLIVCNEEGKINGMDPCRGIYDADNKLIEVICGPFFICRDSEDGEFVSLTKEDQEKYLKEFYRPEALVVSKNHISMVPYENEISEDLEL